jgi:hypothetical protein
MNTTQSRATTTKVQCEGYTLYGVRCKKAQWLNISFGRKPLCTQHEYQRGGPWRLQCTNHQMCWERRTFTTLKSFLAEVEHRRPHGGYCDKCFPDELDTQMAELKALIGIE